MSPLLCGPLWSRDYDPVWTKPGTYHISGTDLVWPDIRQILPDPIRYLAKKNRELPDQIPDRAACLAPKIYKEITFLDTAQPQLMNSLNI